MSKEKCKRCGQKFVICAMLLVLFSCVVPDRPARCPLVIRYTDMRLRAIASDFDEEETEFRPQEVEDEQEETE